MSQVLDLYHSGFSVHTTDCWIDAVKADDVYSRQDCFLPELVLKALTYSAVFVYPIEDLVQKNIPTKLELLLKTLYCEPVSFLVFILSHYKPDKILLFLWRNTRKDSSLTIK